MVMVLTKIGRKRLNGTIKQRIKKAAMLALSLMLCIIMVEASK
jgi:hypothetical protein